MPGSEGFDAKEICNLPVFSRLNEQTITADFVWFSWSESGKIEAPKVANMAFYCAKIEQIYVLPQLTI